MMATLFRFWYLILLLTGNLLFVNMGQTQTPQRLKKTMDSLTLINEHFKRYNHLLLENKALNEQLKTNNHKLLKNKVLKEQVWAVADQRDSLQKLLNNSRYRERRYRSEAFRLKKMYEDTQDKADSLQKLYDEISAGSGATLGEYRKQIEQLTIERNGLASQNQALQAELAELKEPAVLFALVMYAVSGKAGNGSFFPTINAQNTDRMRVSFQLTHPLRVSENLVIKLFDANEKEIPLKKAYRRYLSLAINQKLIVEFQRKLLRGNYYVRLFLTDVNVGVSNRQIGISEFSLR